MSTVYLPALACSLIPIVLLDAARIKVRLALAAGTDIVPLITVAWITGSAFLSFQSLCRTTNARSTRSSLPLVAARRAQTNRASLGELTVAVTFAHAWLLLNRFVAAIHDTNIVDLYIANTDSPWACISLWWTIPAILLFGYILNKCDVGKEKWGYFLVAYELLACGSRIILFTLFTFIALFDAGQAGLDHFRGGHGIGLARF